ncbi:NAD(P)/FAD-dependent oxidoreductase [Spongiibacter sp. KMU-158]|uniref:NAD(P)/FAD-dependent oxidoreductase n=1 Tax=Spongiibacter pelagi TaxID=2760804 RepID=A0A927C363_9GAMM|nr:NAD(P)/FAD-dependent oxidoreductase [Spongiibacter pelagi]MBD2858776.1 NAD(P)/FAD-dependent oxidoreductase [Spongiibacter pelagi]
MQSTAQTTQGNHFDVILVGAGLSGIDAGYRLQTECPDRSYTILEGREAMGGTWDLFRYPGIRSDSDMSTLGFPFEPWDSDVTIADGGDILDYIVRTAKKYGIDKNIRYRHRMLSANWESANSRWVLTVSTPEGEQTFTCNFLYSCSGYYNYAQGYTPDFPGIETFKGELVHPQFWDQQSGVAGKKITVIGSGATAITLVPNLVKEAAHVTMLQRTPTYVINMPKRDKIATALRKIMPNRMAGFMTRWKNLFVTTWFYNFARRRPDATRNTILHLAQKQLGPDVDARKHFQPGYNPWDQRLCVATGGDLFKVLREKKASIVTDRIARFVENGIETESGQLIESDMVITATGLEVQMFGGAQISNDGQPVNVAERMIYKGMMIDGLPNFAFAFGYTNASWTLKCDLTANYICRILNRMKKQNYAVCKVQSDTSVEPEKMLDLDSGYINRAQHVMPKQGSKKPWRVHQNYFKDMFATRFARINDGVLSFEKGSDSSAPAFKAATAE